MANNTEPDMQWVQRWQKQSTIEYWEEYARYGNIKYQILTTYMWQQHTITLVKKWAKDKYGVEVIDLPKLARFDTLLKYGKFEYVISFYYDFMVEVSINEFDNEAQKFTLVYHTKFGSLDDLLKYLGDIVEGRGDGTPPSDKCNCDCDVCSCEDELTKLDEE